MGYCVVIIGDYFLKKGYFLLCFEFLFVSLRPKGQGGLTSSVILVDFQLPNYLSLLYGYRITESVAKAGRFISAYHVGFGDPESCLCGDFGLCG